LTIHFAVVDHYKGKEVEALTPEMTAQIIKSILENKKAKNIEIVDLEGKTILADRFIIATGTSVTHIRSLSAEVEHELKDKHQRLPDHIEGLSTGRWILMDYGDVVVHLFHAEERDFYNLEKLWQSSRK
jgi:ribosome-associated protein